LQLPTRCRWGDLLAAAAVLGSTEQLPAQQSSEIGVQAVATFSEPGVGVLGGYGALRTSERTRLSAMLGAGLRGEDFAVRGELLGHFLLSPGERRAPGFYFAGGLAGLAGEVSRGYLVLTLGLESRPASNSGWTVEAGIGGGFRMALGYRWRFRLRSQAP
jgi:hypothetical protein